MQSATDTEKLAAFIARVCAIDGDREPETDPELYLRVSAGDAVRSARMVVSGISVADKTEAELADECRGAVWRNAGSRVYVVAVCAEGEKSPRETVTLRMEVEEDETGSRAGSGPVGELTRAVVKMAAQADERAMFVARRNTELADRCLDQARELTLAQARLRYADDMAAADESRMFAEAAGKFAEVAATVLVPVLAAKWGLATPEAQPGAQTTSADASALAELETLIDRFDAWSESHPGGLACPEGFALLQRLEATAKQNLAARAPEVAPEAPSEP